MRSETRAKCHVDSLKRWWQLGPLTVFNTRRQGRGELAPFAMFSTAPEEREGAVRPFHDFNSRLLERWTTRRSRGLKYPALRKEEISPYLWHLVVSL